MKKVLHDPRHGTLHDIVEWGAEFPIAAPFEWIDADDAIDQTWELVNEIPTAPSGLTLDEAKFEARGTINEVRDFNIRQGVEYVGALFDSDDRSIGLLSSTITYFGAAAIPPVTVLWRDMNDIDHEFTLAQLVELSASMFTHIEATILVSWDLKDQITVAGSVEIVDAVKWPEE